jgi:hypothetical protein
VAVPVCFVEDTLYYMVMELENQEFSLWYGPWELFTCSFSLIGDTAAPSGFIERWRSPDRAPWQAVKRRGVWSGKPAVSDTVIRVVSEVSKVDPELIKRVYPNRFRLDLTGGFRLLVLTPEGETQERGWAEIWDSYASQITSFGRTQELTVVVSPADAQSLYYALEPGTPVVVDRAETGP